MGVTTESSVLKFTLKELENLIKDVDSQVYLKKDVKYPLKLTPACLQNVNQAITEILSVERLKYIPKYKGLLLAYKHVRRHSNVGTINDDECNILIHIHVDLYIFAPEIGCTMTGIATKVSEDNVACLVHKGFNVTLPRPRNKEAWDGSSVQPGDRVKFQLDTFNVVGTLPFIRGTLLSHEAVKREPGAVDFSEEWDLPVVDKRKKRAAKDEATSKNPSRKKKESVESDWEGEEPLPDAVKAKEEKYEASDETETVETVCKKAKNKKRKSDPVVEATVKSVSQISAKKKLKLSLNSTAESAPVKGSLSWFLASEDEDDFGKDSSQAVEPSKEKKKKSKLAVLEEDSTIEKSDLSVETLVQNALKEIGGGKKKSKRKSGKSDDFGDTATEASSRKKLKTPMAKPVKLLDSKTENVLHEGEPEEYSFSLGTENLKKMKKKNCDVLELQTAVEVTRSGKKKKTKATERADSTAEDFGGASVEALMQQAMDSVCGKTPKASSSKKKSEKEASAKATSAKKKPELCKNSEELDAFSELGETAKSRKKMHDAASKDLEKNSWKTPSKSAAKGVENYVNPCDFTPSTEAESHTRTAGKRKNEKAKPSNLLADTLETPSKSAAKTKSRSSLLDFLDSDEDLPTPAVLLAKMPADLLKSQKKSKKTKLSNEEILKTPSELASQVTVTKKSKKLLVESLPDDIILPTPAEMLWEHLDKRLKTPKKNVKSRPLGEGEIVLRSSKQENDSETTSAEKNKPTSSKKNNGSNQTPYVENKDIFQTPSKQTKNSKASSTQKISKSFLKADDFESGTEKLVSKSVESTFRGADEALQKTPVGYRRPFVQYPVGYVPKNSVATLSETAKKSSSAKKSKKSEVSQGDLLKNLLSMERSVQFEPEESPTLKLSSKKKNMK